MTDHASNSVVCPTCNTTVTGRFCSHCGTDVGSANAAGPVAHLMGEFVNAESTGYLGTLTTVLKSPVRGTVKLANTPGYKGYKSFFFTNSAVSIAATTYAFKQQTTGLGSNPEIAEFVQQYGDYYGLGLTVLQYIGVFGGFLIGYWIFRMFAKDKRTPGDYFKLTCLTAGFGALISLIIQGLNIAFPQAGDTQFAGENPTLVISLGITFIAIAIFLLYYSFRTQMLFWNMSVGRTLLSLVLVGILMWVTMTLLVMVIGGAAAVALGGI